MGSKGTKIGVVTHFYSNIGVGIVKLSIPFKVGGSVRVEGHTTDFEQTIDSMQFDHKTIDEGKKGQEVGVKMKEKVREGDEIYLVE